MILDFISYLIFGNHCKYCRELIRFGEELCEECKTDLPRINGEKCKYCGAGKDRCTCKKARTRYDGITAPFYYEKNIKKSIREFKFADKPYIARVLAKDLAQSVKKDFEGVEFDFIDFIPFSKKQNASRKYNPAGELAKELARELGIPVRHVLVKIFETQTQHNTGAIYRSGNVLGVYDVTDGSEVKGKTVLLVDDIGTTRTTLTECTKILKIAGAEKVYCAVAAISANKKTPESYEQVRKKRT